MAKERFLEIVGSCPKPGREKEYLEWYNRHINDLFKFGGLKRASLNKIYQPIGEKGTESPLYVTIYEFNSKEELAGFYEKGMIPSDGVPFKKEILPDSVDFLWAGYYEPVKTLEK